MKQYLTDFFQVLDREFQANSAEGSFIQIELFGQVIEMRFLTQENAKSVASYLVPPVLNDRRKPDSIFCYWTEDCRRFAPKGSEGETGIWQSKDETGYLRVTPELEMIGIDYMRDAYYHCRNPINSIDYEIHGHSLASVFGQWAIRNNALLLHSACVGIDGKGVMICARSGGGKSTLAISCMMDGFDFVSDDYILVNQEGQPEAFPLYRVIGINQDMAEILRPDLPIMRIEAKRNDKLYLDASAYEMKSSLPIRAIISPVITDIKEPKIVRSKPGNVLTKVIDSTAKQMRVFRDPEPYRLMAKRLMNIPVYEFYVTKDLYQNTTYLKNYIAKEL